MQLGKKGVVLVVDDVESEIDILVDILDRDYEVSVAMDGISALETAEAVSPDLILLDVLMPDLDGYEVCRCLKSNPLTREIPVIFVTVLSEEGYEATGLALGALDYITKPFNRDIVLARVRNHMELIEAHRLKEDVNRIISHDMRNELTAIIGYPDILLRSPNLTENQRVMVDKIRHSGFVLLNLVNLDLQLYNMERGLYMFRPGEVEVPKMLQRLAGHIESLRATRSISLEMTLAGSPFISDSSLVIRGEELLLHSMLFNLLVNAIEASPHNGTVAVDARQEQDCVITIHNMGAVPVAIRDRFFGKYVTAGKETGTGLGTYSAMLIAKTHGGSIEMQTSEETGTRITIRLPC